MAFETFGVVSEEITGTAPTLFSASTADSLAVLTAPGYMNYLSKLIKANDLVFVNYSDVSAFPLNTGEQSIFGEFQVTYDPVLANWSLQALQPSQGRNPIAAAGVHSALFTNAGGSATTTLFDVRLNANQIVLARWQSSANAVFVEKVTVSNGSLVVLSSGDPGASVLEYIAVTPSVLLQNMGLHATFYSNAGGSATLTITDPLITASSVVNVNFSSSANAVGVIKVTPGAGTLTVLCSADPGVSVLSYIAVTPSSTLTAFGLYGAKASNAGGSATVTITDANITATSIVMANIQSSVNSVNVEKVTPTAGTLTILNSGDAGAAVFAYMATPVPE